MEGLSYQPSVFVSADAFPHSPRRKARPFINLLLAWSLAWSYDCHLLQSVWAHFGELLPFEKNMKGIACSLNIVIFPCKSYMCAQ